MSRTKPALVPRDATPTVWWVSIDGPFKNSKSAAHTAQNSALRCAPPPPAGHARPSIPMKGKKRFDIDQLVKDVMEAFEDYPPEQLEKMWQHKSYVMRAVLTTQPNFGWRLELPASRPPKAPSLERAEGHHMRVFCLCA